MKNKTPVEIGQGAFYIGKKEPEQQEQEAYSPLYNTKGTRALATIPTTPARAEFSFEYHPMRPDDKWSLFAPEDITIDVKDDPTNLHFGQATMFFHYLIKVFTRQTPHLMKAADLEDPRTRVIPIDIEEYTRLQGKKITKSNKANTVREIKKAIKTLDQMTVIVNEIDPKTGKPDPFRFRPISGEALTKKGRSYSFVLNFDVVRHLKKTNYITKFPNAAFKIDIMRYPSAFSLAVALSFYYSMNRGRSNQGIISFKALMKRISDIPTPEEVREEGHATRRIIDKLEDALKHLKEVGVLESWEWANERKTPLTDEQFKQIIKKGTLKVVSECYLIYIMKDYPDEKPALEAPKIAKISDLTHPEKE